MGLVERLWSRTEVRGTCWVFTGARSDGYGVIHNPAGSRLAHRAVFELIRGQVAAGHDLDHLCRNRACWNPWHLEPVTRRTNLVRGVGRPATADSDQCRRGHSFRYPPQGVRYCPTCKADADRRRHRRRSSLPG